VPIHEVALAALPWVAVACVMLGLLTYLPALSTWLHCCNAWSKFAGQPWRSMSIGLRDWAYRS
jgi:hypothetical protein